MLRCVLCDCAYVSHIDCMLHVWLLCPGPFRSARG